MSEEIVEPMKNYRWISSTCSNIPPPSTSIKHKCDDVVIVVIQEPMTNSVQSYHLSTCQLATIINLTKGITQYDLLKKWKESGIPDPIMYNSFFGRRPLLCVSKDPFYPYTQTATKEIMFLTLPHPSVIRSTVFKIGSP